MRLSALAAALRLLRYRGRSKSELRRKLQERRYDLSEIETVLKQLEENNLLNDEQLAVNFARDRLQIYRRGRHVIGLEMLKKGLDRNLIDTTLKAITNDDELEVARNLLLARDRQWSNLDPLTRKRRAIALLQRRGFAPLIIRQLLLTKNQ